MISFWKVDVGFLMWDAISVSNMNIKWSLLLYNYNSWPHVKACQTRHNLLLPILTYIKINEHVLSFNEIRENLNR